MFSLNSCSTVPSRIPAEADNEFFKAVFSIARGNIKSELSLEEKIRDELRRQEIPIEQLNFKIELVESAKLPEKTAYNIQLVIDPNRSKLIYRMLHAPDIFSDAIAAYNMMDYLGRIVLPSQLQSPFSIFELYHNAKSGDPIAIDTFFKLRSMPNENFPNQHVPYLETENYLKNKKELELLRSKLAKEIQAIKKNRAYEKAKRKKELAHLDKANQEGQFRTLISKGDRSGAANILKQYLPWEEMAPFEKQFWETYLEVVANPVPLEERVLIYRGADGDFIHKAHNEAKILTDKEAIAQNKAFFMSSLMTKNQGSWNRRLRSLESMNNKFIATVSDSNEFTSSARISTMFMKHSGNPQGSPFLSFTPKYNVADDFGAERISAYLMDPRLLNFNYTSLFEEELEYLVPLTTFPDELVGIVEEAQTDTNPPMTRKQLMAQKLEKLILDTYGAERKDEVLSKIKRNSFDFFKTEYTEMVDPQIESIGKSNLIFYENFTNNKKSKQVLTPAGDLSCKDLIELFWIAK